MSPPFDLEEYGMIRTGWCVVLEIVNYTSQNHHSNILAYISSSQLVHWSTCRLVNNVEDYKIIVRLI